MTTKELLAQFNVRARTDYNREYQEFEPKFGELLYEYESGPVETMDFPFFGFLKGMAEFKGQRVHETFPDGHKFQVTNKEWDYAVDVPIKDIDRAAQLNSLNGLNIYTQRIGEIPKMVKDHPVELAFDMIEAGDANTYGTTFDLQNFFDTTHDYAAAAGTQSNIITSGSGVTAGAIRTDFQAALSRFQSFTVQQGTNAQGTSNNSKKRKLNKTMDKLLIVCPTELFGVFEDLRTQGTLATGETNPMKGRFELVSMPFTDTGDWYIFVLDSPTFKPFLFQKEKDVELDMPTPQDENAREYKTYTWGAYGRYAVAYGAWWTGIMVENS